LIIWVIGVGEIGEAAVSFHIGSSHVRGLLATERGSLPQSAGKRAKGVIGFLHLLHDGKYAVGRRDSAMRAPSVLVVKRQRINIVVKFRSVGTAQSLNHRQKTFGRTCRRGFEWRRGDAVRP